MQLETEVKRLVDFSLCALVSRYKYIHLILFSFQNWIQRDPVMSRKSIACIPYKMHTIERTSAVFANEDRLKILPLNNRSRFPVRCLKQQPYQNIWVSTIFEFTSFKCWLTLQNQPMTVIDSSDFSWSQCFLLPYNTMYSDFYWANSISYRPHKELEQRQLRKPSWHQPYAC